MTSGTGRSSCRLSSLLFQSNYRTRTHIVTFLLAQSSTSPKSYSATISVAPSCTAIQIMSLVRIIEAAFLFHNIIIVSSQLHCKQRSSMLVPINGYTMPTIVISKYKSSRCSLLNLQIANTILRV